MTIGSFNRSHVDTNGRDNLSALSSAMMQAIAFIIYDTQQNGSQPMPMSASRRRRGERAAMPYAHFAARIELKVSSGAAMTPGVITSAATLEVGIIDFY